MNESRKVAADEAGQRLDVFVTEALGSVSRSAIKRAIQNGAVTVNGKPAKPHLALKEGDVVEIPKIEMPPHATPIAPEPRPDIHLDIVHEDGDVIVINKPSGLLVHPSVLREKETVAAALLAHVPDISGVGESPERPGIVHRLDKEASGLMVVAKNQRAYEHLKRQFRNREIDKRYQILVNGRPPKDSGTIDLAIGRAAGERRMAAHSDPIDGDRPAVTHYSVLRHLRNSALISVKTETGRTHQIRAHFRAIGCPVAGDKLYGSKRDRLGVGRLFLHAESLAFMHPSTGERMEFRSPLPAELETAIKRLSLSKD